MLKTALALCIASALTAAVVYILWTAGAFLPRWIRWTSASFQDETGDYQIVLSHKTVSVTWRSNSTRRDNSAGQDSAAGQDSTAWQESTAGQDNAAGRDAVIWTSPKGVLVQKVLSADIDNDHREELVLLCWKIGHYGKDKPFWVEKDKKEWSQHLFVYEYVNGEIKPKWMSSYLGKDLADVTAYRRADSVNRLIFTDLEGKASCWKWDSWGFTLEDASVSFIAFGDNLIHEPLYRYGLQNDEAFGFLFENLQAVISESDVAVINQETPLVDNPLLYSDYPKFGTPIGVGEAIVNAGFDVVTCATNHALDKGKDGVKTTREFFDFRNVTCLGIQTEEETEYRPYEIIMKKGIRFALLNYTYGTNGIKIPENSPHMVHLLDDEERIRKDIENARAEADFVILFVHWGTENSTETDEFQKKWTEVFLDSRVDVVIGTHPHTLQPCEVLTAEDEHEMLVYYSIGNFISTQPEQVCTKGGMASFTVSPTADGYKITEYSLDPLAITWHKGGRYTVDYAFTPNPPPDSLSSNSASGIGLE